MPYIRNTFSKNKIKYHCCKIFFPKLDGNDQSKNLKLLANFFEDIILVLTGTQRPNLAQRVNQKRTSADIQKRSTPIKLSNTN